jgi:hypothetical protein
VAAAVRPGAHVLAKYTRITIITRSATSRASAANRLVYSRPVARSWMEHGPTMRRKRWSVVKMT